METMSCRVPTRFVAYQGVHDREGESFRFDPDLLVFGFDENDVPAIFALGEDGEARLQHESGYAAIGAPERVARHVLAWQNVRPNMRLHQVLYATYAARRHADRYSSVGETITAWILVRDCEQPIPVPPDVELLMSNAFDVLDGPVFGERKKEPDRWRENLEQQVDEFVRKAKVV
jgi:hypothetical protein